MPIAVLSRRLITAASFCAALVVGADGRASDLDALHADISAIVAENQVRGGAYAVIDRGEVTALRTFGHADAEAERPVTSGTLFRVGSISKAVTSLLAMSAVEDGLIALDTPITDVLPGVGIENPWRDAAPLRLVHLLEHTGGLPGSSFYEYAQVGPDVSPSAYLTRMQGRLTLRWPPGRYYSYANGGHTIAARMLEAVSGQTFDVLARVRVFEPLDMPSATFSTRPSATDDLSQSFAADGVPAPSWQMAVRPSGSLAASIDDMARLARFLATEGASVAAPPVSADGLRRMRRGATSLPARHGYDYAYGLGMFGFIAANRVFWGHWGKTEGFLANLGVLPDHGKGFVLLSNTSNRRAMSEMRERLAAHVAHDLSASTTAPPAQVTPDPAFAGFYLPFTHDMALRGWIFALLQAVIVEHDDGVLQVRPLLPIGAATTLSPVSDRFFTAGDFPVATHLFLDDDGRTVLFGDGQETYRKLYGAVAFAVKAGLLIGVASVVVGILTGVVMTAVWLFGRAKAGQTAVVICFGAAAGLLPLFIVTFVLFDVMAPFNQVNQLGEVGARSLLLLLLSVTWPLLALLGGVLLVRRWRGLPIYLQGIGVFVAAGYLMIAGVMVWQDWLPLVTWRA